MISTTDDLDRLLAALFAGELLPPELLRLVFTLPPEERAPVPPPETHVRDRPPRPVETVGSPRSSPERKIARVACGRVADLHEVLITAELPADLPAAETAELRWHLGIGPRPETSTVVVDGWPLVTVGEDGEPLPEEQWEIDTYPLLAGRGPADPRIGGVVFSELARREGPVAPGWALSSRQVLHSEDLPLLGQLLRWLQGRAVGHGGGPACFRCHTRFYEDGPELKPVALDGEARRSPGAQGR
jgi:hypothetical protein